MSSIDEAGAAAPAPEAVAAALAPEPMAPAAAAKPARKPKPAPVSRSPFVVTARVEIATSEAGDVVAVDAGAIVALTAEQATANAGSLRAATELELSRLGQTPTAI